MKNKKLITILIIFNILIIGTLGWFVFSQSVNIKYMNLKNYPKSIYLTYGEMPYLFKTQNGSLIMVFSKFNEIQGQQNGSVEIFLISSENIQEWNKIVQITNDSYRNRYPKLVQQNESTFRLYYSSIPSNNSWNWKYIESKNLMNWSNPMICEKPLINQYWSEINNPPYFEQAKEYPERYSLIKNHKGKYIFAGIHDISSTDIANYKIFIMTSNNGKDWNLPIKIRKEDCHHYFQSLIEIENGTYVLAYQYTENYEEKINIITFSDSDLKNTNKPITVYIIDGIIIFVFFLILIFISDSMIIVSVLRKKKVT